MAPIGCRAHPARALAYADVSEIGGEDCNPTEVSMNLQAICSTCIEESVAEATDVFIDYADNPSAAGIIFDVPFACIDEPEVEVEVIDAPSPPSPPAPPSPPTPPPYAPGPV